MNILANRCSMTEHQKGAYSWDWTNVKPDLVDQNASVQGQKRRVDDTLTRTDSTASNHKRIKQELASSTPRSIRTPEPHMHNRNSRSSSHLSKPASAPFTQGDKHGVKSVSAKRPAPIPPRGGIPFIQIDDNSDDDISAPPTTYAQPQHQPAPIPRFRFTSNDDKTAQRIKSEQKREEARARRKDEGCNSSPALDGSDHPRSPPIKHGKTTVHIHNGIAAMNSNGDQHINLEAWPSRGGPPSAKPAIKTEYHDFTSTPPKTTASSMVIDLTEDDPVEIVQNRESPLQKQGLTDSDIWKMNITNRLKRKEETEQSKIQSIAQERQRKQAEEVTRREAEVKAWKHRQEQVAIQLREEHRIQKAKRREQVERDHQRHEQQERERQAEAEEAARQAKNQEAMRQVEAEAAERERQKREDQHTQRMVAVRERQRLELVKRQKNEEEALAQEEKRQKEARAREEARQKEERRKKQKLEAEMAAFHRKKAEADLKEAEKKRLADQEKQEEERKKKADREKRKAEAAKPLADREREEDRAKAKAERIQKQIERNNRNREYDNDDIIIDEDPQPSSYQPTSLASAAKQADGRQTVPPSGFGFSGLPSLDERSASSAIPGPNQVSRSTTAFPEGRSQKVKFGEITYDDTQLLKWRSPRWSHSWDIIIENFKKILEKSRSRDHLRHRFKELCALLERANVDSDTIATLYLGDSKIIDQVNMMVDHLRYTPIYPETKKQRQQEQKQRQKEEREQRTPHRQSSVQKKGTGVLASIVSKTKPKPSSTFSSFTGGGVSRNTSTVPPQAPALALPRVPAPPALPAPPQARPSTGGKKMDENFFFLMLDQQAAAFQEQEEEQQVQEAEELGADAEDYIYYVYQVFRREWTLEDIERCEDEGEEEPEWMQCHGEYEQVSEANVAASKEVTRAIPGRLVFADDGANFHLSSDLIEDGMRHYKLTNSSVGKVEVEVQRMTRTFEDRILPSSKEGWLSKTVYEVQQQVTKRVIDEVLDEAKEETLISHVDQRVYTHLPQANEVAAKRLVELTYRSDCRNLTVRDAEKHQRAQEILESLPEGELLDAETDWDEGDDEHNKTVKVWVTEKILTGPRN